MKRIRYGSFMTVGITLVVLMSASGWAQDAQDAVIAWDVVGAGGEIGVGDGTYNVSFTLGQPIVGTVDGGVMALQQGFWLPLSSTSGVEIPDNVDEQAVVHGYPNPFSATTEISFRVSTPAHIRIRIFDMLGREVRCLMDGARSAGRSTIPWDGNDRFGHGVPSGNYVCRLELQSETATESATTAHVLMLQVRR